MKNRSGWAGKGKSNGGGGEGWAIIFVLEEKVA